VPAGTSRLRFTFSAAHREERVLALAAAVRALVVELGEPSDSTTQ
jgi:7-keto-8-aminopelargonate synthetase-like enzyme